MSNTIALTNKNGTLTRYAFTCGYVERIAWDFDGYLIVCGNVPLTDNYSELSLANGEINLWNIRVKVDGHQTIWLQRSGLTRARKCFARCKSIVKNFIKGKLNVDEAHKQLEFLGFEK